MGGEVPLKMPPASCAPDELDLAVNTSAARTVIMTAADWEVLEVFFVVEGWMIINCYR